MIDDISSFFGKSRNYHQRRQNVGNYRTLRQLTNECVVDYNQESDQKIIMTIFQSPECIDRRGG